MKSAGGTARPLLVTALLGAVAAVVDVAPAAAVILGGVDEEPAAAVLVRALPQPLIAFRGHQIGCGKRQGPERRIQRVLVDIPLPLEPARTAHYLCTAGWVCQQRVQDRQVALGGRLA